MPRLDRAGADDVSTPLPDVDADLPGAPARAAAALERTGAVVVRRLIDSALVGALIADVLALGEPRPAGSRYEMAFVERSGAMLELLSHEGFLRIAQALVKADELVVNRSAAILRSAGSPVVQWHSDFHDGSGVADAPDAVLNRGEWPNGLWFYLTGCRNDHGGLWVIPGSHRTDWQPAPPLRLSSDRRVLLGANDEPVPLAIPGAVPVQAEPGDLVAFAARTYHAAASLEAGLRLSCGLSFRPRRHAVSAPWPVGQDTGRWLSALPARLQPFFDGYSGYPRPAAR
jgi:hypothetical protein